jgi:hypothetical protein
MREPPNGRVDTVRGRLDEADSAAVLALWEESGVLTGDAARSRLDQVVCLYRDASGEPAGVSWAYPDAVEMIAGLPFWMYQSVLDAASGDAAPALLAHTYAHLEAGHEPGDGGPLGLCLMLRDRAVMEARPEARWEDPEMVYAGYGPDGTQVRVGYFPGATI